MRLNIFIFCLPALIFALQSVALCQDDRDVWEILGFSEQEKERWLKAGLKEDESDWAEMYRKEGLTPEEAVKEKKIWKKEGYVRSHTPNQWKVSRFTIDEALKWKHAGFENPFLADNYRKAGFGCEEAKKWSNVVGSSYKAEKWKSYGFTPELSAQWSKNGYSPEEARDSCLSSKKSEYESSLKCPDMNK